MYNYKWHQQKKVMIIEQILSTLCYDFKSRKAKQDFSVGNAELEKKKGISMLA